MKSSTIAIGLSFALLSTASGGVPIPATCTDTVRGSGVVLEGGSTPKQGSFTINVSSRRGRLHGRVTYTDAQTGVSVTANKVTRYEADVFSPEICRYMELQGKTSTGQDAFVSVFVCDEATLGTADAFSIYVDPVPHSIFTEIIINGNLISGDIAVQQRCR